MRTNESRSKSEDEPISDPMEAHDLFPHMKKEEGPLFEPDPLPVDPIEGPV